MISTKTKWGSQSERFKEVQDVKRIRNCYHIKTSKAIHRLSMDFQQKCKTFLKKQKERTSTEDLKALRIKSLAVARAD